ncbi:MAG: DUF6152 family protein [Pseudomonadota bacterium]
MKQASLGCVSVAIVLLSIAGMPTTAHAHHSFAMFNQSESVSLRGVLLKVEWTNPHVYFLVQVAGSDGTVQSYTIEGGSVNKMVRAGWKPNTLKVGEKVSFVIHPTRDGKPGGMLVSVKREDGTVYKG